MANEQIQPDKVTKPIQLLAAWLAGLIITDGAFLTSAALISRPDWASGALVVAAILNVPLFLTALFLLQTKFRPEMQEDAFYSKHLERVYSAQTRKMEVLVHKDTPEIRLVGKNELRLHPPANRIERGTIVELNDLLPRHNELQAALESHGILVSSTFGSSSQDPKVPRRFVVAFGADVPLPAVLWQPFTVVLTV